MRTRADIKTNGRILLKGIKRVAEYYNCSVQKIQDLVNDGTLPNYRLGRTRYFYADEIDEALRDRTFEKKQNENS